jgi:hypothetical protein
MTNSTFNVHIQSQMVFGVLSLLTGYYKLLHTPTSALTLVNEGFGVNTCSTLLIAEGFLLFLTSMGMGNYISDIRKY